MDVEKISISGPINIYLYVDGWGYIVMTYPCYVGFYDNKAVRYSIDRGGSKLNVEAIDRILKVDDEIALVGAGNKMYLKSPSYTTMLVDYTWIIAEPDIAYPTQHVANSSPEHLVFTKIR